MLLALGAVDRLLLEGPPQALLLVLFLRDVLADADQAPAGVPLRKKLPLATDPEDRPVGAHDAVVEVERPSLAEGIFDLLADARSTLRMNPGQVRVERCMESSLPLPEDLVNRLGPEHHIPFHVPFPASETGDLFRPYEEVETSPEAALGASDGSHVLRDGAEPDGPAGFIAHGGQEEGHVYGLAVLPAQSSLEVGERLAPMETSQDLRGVDAEGGRKQDEGRFPDRFFFGETEKALGRRIPEDDSSVRVGSEDRQRAGFKDRFGAQGSRRPPLPQGRDFPDVFHTSPSPFRAPREPGGGFERGSHPACESLHAERLRDETDASTT